MENPSWMATCIEELPDYVISFAPLDEELIMSYLKPLVEGEALPPEERDLVQELDIYATEPWELLGNFKNDAAYFFSPRHRVARGGSRVKRTAGRGFWDGSGHEVQISLDGEVIGTKNSFTFRHLGDHQGAAPAAEARGKKGQATDYLLKEYLLPASSKKEFQEMALYKMYKKISSSSKKRPAGEFDQGSLMPNYKRICRADSPPPPPPPPPPSEDRTFELLGFTFDYTGSGQEEALEADAPPADFPCNSFWEEMLHTGTIPPAASHTYS